MSLIWLILQLNCKYRVHIQKKKALNSSVGILKTKVDVQFLNLFS